MKPFIFLLLCAVPAQCQDRLLDRDNVEQAAGKEEEDRDLVADATRQGYKDVLARRLRLEIESMRQHLKLSDNDAKKLHLAGKGAVAAMVKQNSSNVVQGVLRKIKNGTAKETSINGVPIIKENEEEEPLAGVTTSGYRVVILINHSQTLINVARPNGGWGGTDGGGGFRDLLTQEIWTKNRDKVLSKEQLGSFEDYREKVTRSHLTEMLTGQLSLKLRLSIEERTRLRGWIEKQIAAQKIDPRYDPSRFAPQLLSKFKYKTLKGILSDDLIDSLQHSSSVNHSRFGLGFGF